MASVIRYLDSCEQPPDLAGMAESFGLSPTRLHKLFHAWVGITPKAFLQCLSLNRAKALLRQGDSVMSAALDSGLSGPGRLHDLCCKLEAASPGEIKSAGEGWTLHYAFAETVFGMALIAESPRGICHIGFVHESENDALQGLQQDWRNALLVEDAARIEALAKRIFPEPGVLDRGDYRPLRLLVRGSEFQIKVWRALLHLPFGEVLSYRHVAAVIGHPGAARAVGSAMANNSLAYLIPCHRVIRGTGAIGEYHWGTTRKRCMLAWEQGQLGYSRHSRRA